MFQHSVDLIENWNPKKMAENVEEVQLAQKMSPECRDSIYRKPIASTPLFPCLLWRLSPSIEDRGGAKKLSPVDISKTVSKKWRQMSKLKKLPYRKRTRKHRIVKSYTKAWKPKLFHWLLKRVFSLCFCTFFSLFCKISLYVCMDRS